MRRIDGHNERGENYPTISENAGVWLIVRWTPRRFRAVEGIESKPHLYYA